MARYYNTRQTASSSLPRETYHDVVTSRDASHRYPDTENALTSSSILVFPSPPSERGSSRDESRYDFTGSTPSLPTDVSLGSLRSRSGSRDEQIETWHDIYQISQPLRDEDTLETGWELDLSGENMKSVWNDTSYRNNINRSAGRHTRTNSNVSSPSGAPSSISPQPPFRLPLLSCLQTFLDLDESTLHLLSRSPNPQTSVLFPFSPGSPSSLYEESEEESAHGVHKLLLHNPDKPINGVLLRAAMESHEVSTSSYTRLSFPASIPVWQFVEFVMEGGLRAWRRAPQLVGA